MARTACDLGAARHFALLAVSRVAIVTCAGANDPDNPRLFAALTDLEVSADLVVWDDDAVRWDDYDLVVLRSTWDYPSRRAEFLKWASSRARLENPLSVIEYNSDKHYLSDLEAHGLAIIPSHFCAVGETPGFPVGDFVVKPCVGAGSLNVERYRESEVDAATRHVQELHGKGRDVLIQPYIHSVDTIGERGLIFIDGTFSHAMSKGAMLNVAQDARDFLFRREQMSSALAEADAILYATEVLSTMGLSDLLYARVDLVATIRGWLVMELELVEPSLYLTFDNEAATKLASGIAKRLG
jgi:glutathione synthase/RimK-type ligase-like ATP-grasp enzyme